MTAPANPTLEEFLRSLLSKACNHHIGALSGDLQLSCLGIDSVGCFAVCVAIEAELEVSIDPDELSHILARGTGLELMAHLIEMQNGGR